MVRYAEAQRRCHKTMDSRGGFQLGLGRKTEFEYFAGAGHRQPSGPGNALLFERLAGSERRQVSNKRVKRIPQELQYRREIGRSVTPPASHGGNRLRRFQENSHCVFLRILAGIGNFVRGESGFPIAECSLPSTLPLTPAATNRLQGVDRADYRDPRGRAGRHSTAKFSSRRTTDCPL
jgi:hypothetical protein